jgi:antitoxin ParD1/3/4
VPYAIFLKYGGAHDGQHLPDARACAFLQSRVKSGRYQTTSEVVREALRLLQHQEREREAGLKQLKTKLQRGAAQAERGELLDSDEVFEELRQLIEERRRAKKKVTRA